MSDSMEFINLDSMTAYKLINGEMTETYKVLNCDDCNSIRPLDEFGYQKGIGGENLLWLCKDCR